MDLSESWALLAARQHPEAIRRALDEHGIPDHLWGLLGWLVGVAHDVPPHSRPDGYTEIMAIVDQAFDHDPINPPHSSTAAVVAPVTPLRPAADSATARARRRP